LKSNSSSFKTSSFDCQLRLVPLDCGLPLKKEQPDCGLLLKGAASIPDCSSQRSCLFGRIYYRNTARSSYEDRLGVDGVTAEELGARLAAGQPSHL
jgi:hypothetical protein